MGMVAMTYKINPDSDVDNVDTDAIATTITGMGDEVYNINPLKSSLLRLASNSFKSMWSWTMAKDLQMLWKVA